MKGYRKGNTRKSGKDKNPGATPPGKGGKTYKSKGKVNG